MPRSTEDRLRTFPKAVALLLGALVAGVPTPATPSPASQRGARDLHDVINFTRDHFLSFEHAGPALVEVERCCHGESETSVTVATTSGSAQEGADFTATSKTLRFTQPVAADEVPVPLLNDAEAEPIESFTVAIESASGGASVTFPSEAAVTIVDDDGPARLSMLTPAEEVFENRGPLELTIVRSGDATAAASVTFTTADGSAIAGEDYTPSEGSLTFGAGERLKRVKVSSLNDPDTEGAETFDFVLSAPAGAEITAPSVTTVTIADDEDASSDVEPPITAFHQPLHGKTYGAQQARDILIFADDEASGVRSVDFALQMRMRSGACRWYERREKAFSRGSCGKRVWMRLEPGSEVTVHSLPHIFMSSTGGKRVRFYKAFSRGRDELGNVETSFEYRRNISRFDIR